MYIIRTILLFTTFALYSCNQETATPMEYKQWVENPDNGLKVNKSIHNCTVELQYTPVEYLALRDLITQKRLSDTAFVREVKESEGLLYFTWKIKHNTSQGDILYSDVFAGLNYQDLVHYFSFGVKRDLQLKHGDTLLPCALHHYERSYGLAPHITMVTAFDASAIDHITDDLQFIFNAEPVGLGIIKLKIDEYDIRNLPKVQL